MEGETFLSAVKSTWEDHKVCMRKLRDVLKYMVRGVSMLTFGQTEDKRRDRDSFPLCSRLSLPT